MKKKEEYKKEAKITLKEFDSIAEYLCDRHIKIEGCLLFELRLKKLRNSLFLVKEDK